MSEEQELTFEQALEKLERIVQSLEGGDVPLEKAIEWFQEGMRLSHLCDGKLKHVEQKVTQLMENDRGELGEIPLDMKDKSGEDA